MWWDIVYKIMLSEKGRILKCLYYKISIINVCIKYVVSIVKRIE